ncbi:MAG: hypothetical protein K6E91_00565 [Butyrivibrio sp.]|nr:hypothetical protein [Butyrivibrio sp.]
MDNVNVSGNLTDEEALGLFAVLGSMLVVLIIIGLIFYIVDAIARVKYLRIRGYKASWMAFIPILNIYASVDATYGNVEKINLYGVSLPAIVVKLYPLIFSVITAIVTRIPAISSIGTTIVYICEVIIGIMILKDMLERIGTDISIAFSVLANVIPIIGSIKLLTSCKGLKDCQFDYTTDLRVLQSQSGIN